MSGEEKREYRRIWCLAFPEKVRASKKKCNLKHGYYYEYSLNYRKKHPEVYSKSARRYRRKYPDRCRIAACLKRRKDRREKLGYRILESLRGRVRSALKGTAKSKRTLELLGCSVDSFRIYIESKFETGMTWSNYGKNGWELDHIIPCAIFDLTKPEHQQRCFHFSNLQPLWRSDNLKKGNSISTSQFNLL